MAATNPKPILSSAITTEEFALLMSQGVVFESSPSLAIAVSGGADSMALLLLTQKWVNERGGRIVALTIDHGLRTQSKQEALQVQQWCGALAIEHHILTWKPPPLTTSIQADARGARYRMLVDWCAEHSILHLLTAHHFDDQAETLFMRTLSGSGMDGLACMAVQTCLPPVRLLRPLLSVRKSRLTATLAAHHHAWLEDPSNSNPAYTRNRIRTIISRSPAISLSAAPIINGLAKFRNQLENKTVSQLPHCITLSPCGFAYLDMARFHTLMPEIALRLLSKTIQTLRGDGYPPRSEKLKRLLGEMRGNKIPKRRTFAGLLFIYQPSKSRFLICREPSATTAPVALAANTLLRWDDRFEIRWQSDHKNTEHFEVRPLGRAGLKQCEKNLIKGEKTAFLALPSLWQLETLMCVPHINYLKPGFEHITCDARFYPAKPLAEYAFFGMNTEDKRV